MAVFVTALEVLTLLRIERVLPALQGLPSESVIAGGFVIIGISIAGFAQMSRSPPVACIVDSGGVSLVFRDGQRRAESWANPRLRIRLTEWQPTRPRTGKGTSPPRSDFQHALRIGLFGILPLTPEAFAAILAVAKARGLQVGSRTQLLRRPKETEYRITQTN